LKGGEVWDNLFLRRGTPIQKIIARGSFRATIRKIEKERNGLTMSLWGEGGALFIAETAVAKGGLSGRRWPPSSGRGRSTRKFPQGNLKRGERVGVLSWEKVAPSRILCAARKGGKVWYLPNTQGVRDRSSWPWAGTYLAAHYEENHGSYYKRNGERDRLAIHPSCREAFLAAREGAGYQGGLGGARREKRE